MRVANSDAPSETAMTDLDTALGKFLAQVEHVAPGQRDRFAAPLDELIRWSEARGLTFDAKTNSVSHVRFRKAGSLSWTVTPRGGDGAKLTVAGPADHLSLVRADLARIDGKPGNAAVLPVVSFAKLIWKPYRDEVMGVLGKALPAGETAPSVGVAIG